MTSTRAGRWLRCAASVGGALALGAATSACDIGDPVVEAPTGSETSIHGADNPRVYLSALVSQGVILRADVNGDGVVDIADLVIVAQSFGDVPNTLTSVVTIVDEGIRWVPGRGPDDDITVQSWEFSYQITLVNATRETRSARVVWKWYDASGFLIDEVFVNVLLQGGEERTVTDIETVRNFGPDGTHTAEVVSATVPGIDIDPPPPPG